jgi:putative ABC transport system permease protein
MRTGGIVGTLGQDLRYAARRLRSHPGFTAVAVLTLALGIGANTAIFSVASSVLLRPLPYRHADRLAMVWMDNARIGLREDWHSYPDYRDYLEQNRTFDDIAIFNNTQRTLGGEIEAERVIGAHGSANLFDVLGVTPVRGRTYTPAEDVAGANDVVVLSYALWQRRFGGLDSALESTVQLSGRSVRVIGVMAPGFAFPTRETEFWIPTAPAEALRTSRNSLWLQSIGRLKAGVSIEQAQADLSRINAGLLERFPNRKGYGIYVADLLSQTVGSARPAILVLLAAVACVLLIACANVANLLLARASARDREMALRAALGADRGRLVKQLLTESLLLAGIGGAAGLGLAWAGLNALLAAAPADLPRVQEITLDGWALAFTAGLTMVTGVFFGIIPAWQVARADPNRALHEGGRSATGAGRSVRRGLVVLEVALAVVLLVGAGLMIRSFRNMQAVDLGFNVDRALSARIALFGERYRQPAAVVDFFRQVVERAASAPGIEGAAAINTVFLSATPNSTNFSIEGRPDFAPEDSVEVPVDSVSPGYFRVMNVPLRQGRFFDDRDAAEATPVVIINETMARMFWPKEDPIGRRIKYGQLAGTSPWMTIVGVVADTRRTGFESAVRPETYLPHAQSPSAGMTIIVRASAGAESALPALRASVRAVDPQIPVHQVKPLGTIVDDMTAARRLNTRLLGIFSFVAAVLAGVGIYGVMAYSVALRTRELGVRVALGASSARIMSLVLAEGLGLAAAGIVLGVIGAFAMGRAMQTMLYGVSAADPVTIAAIAALAAVVAIAASVVPAWRAVRIDPNTALRAE